MKAWQTLLLAAMLGANLVIAGLALRLLYQRMCAAPKEETPVPTKIEAGKSYSIAIGDLHAKYKTSVMAKVSEVVVTGRGQTVVYTIAADPQEKRISLTKFMALHQAVAHHPAP